VNCPIARETCAATGSDSAIGDGVLMVGVAKAHYVLKCGDTQHRTLAVRKFSAQNKIRRNAERSTLDREHVAVRKTALEVNVHVHIPRCSMA
jgi:hypothetical protein